MLTNSLERFPLGQMKGTFVRLRGLDVKTMRIQRSFFLSRYPLYPTHPQIPLIWLIIPNVGKQKLFDGSIFKRSEHRLSLVCSQFLPRHTKNFETPYLNLNLSKERTKIK